MPGTLWKIHVLTADANVRPYWPTEIHTTFHSVGDFRLREQVARDGSTILVIFEHLNPIYYTEYSFISKLFNSFASLFSNFADFDDCFFLGYYVDITCKNLKIPQIAG